MIALYIILFLLFPKPQSEEILIGTIAITVDPATNQTYYITKVNPNYFNSKCDMMSFIVLESMLDCGEAELLGQMEKYLPQINKVQKDTSRRTY